MKKVPEIPSGRTRDVSLALAGVFPVGSIAQLLLDMVWPDPNKAALVRFVEELAESVDKLRDRPSFDLEEVLAREETIPLLNRAFDAVSRSVGQQKLEALRVATIKGVFEHLYSFDMSAMIFALLDRVTEGHIRMLRYINECMEKHTGGPDQTMLRMLDVKFQDDVEGLLKPTKQTVIDQYYDQHVADVNGLIDEDLINMGLVTLDQSSPNGMLDMADTSRTPRVLSLKGKLFYEYVFNDIDMRD